MREREVTQIRVGIFVFAGLVLSIIIIFMIGSERSLFEPQYTVYTSFKDISGLRIGAPVQLAGMNVGFVNDIRFPKDLLKKDIDVELRINRRYQERIRRDSVATINTQGLLGDKFVYISIGSENEDVIPNKGWLEGRETTGLFELAEKGQEIVDNVNKLFGDILSEEGVLKDSIKSIRNILKQAETGKGLIHALVYDPKGTEILSDLADSMASLRQILGTETKGRKGRAGTIVNNLEAAAKDVREIMERIKRGEGTLGGFIADPSIYQDIRSFLGRANRNVILKSVIRATIEENEKNTLN